MTLTPYASDSSVEHLNYSLILSFYPGLLNFAILSTAWKELLLHTFLWHGEIFNEEHFTAIMASVV